METVVRCSAGTIRRKSGEGSEKSREKENEGDIDGYEMLVGDSCDSKEARNQFIDSAENLLEFESMRRGQKHRRKNFDNAAAHSELYELQERGV